MVPCKLLGVCQGKYLQFVQYSKEEVAVLHSHETLLLMCKSLDGENLVNFRSVVNFAKIFSQHQSFLPYGKIILVTLILSALLWVACVIVIYSHACTYTLPRQLFIG